MMAYVATLSDGDQVLAQDVTVHIQVKAGVRGWSGSFRLPRWEGIEPGGPYDIALDDGRSGKIVVTSVAVHSDRPTDVSFKGTGPLSG